MSHRNPFVSVYRRVLLGKEIQEGIERKGEQTSEWGKDGLCRDLSPYLKKLNKLVTICRMHKMFKYSFKIKSSHKSLRHVTTC